MSTRALVNSTADKVPKTVVKYGGAVGSHSFLAEEAVAFTEHINNILGRDAYLKEHKYLPLNAATGDLFKAVADGILLSKLLNVAQPETIDERALNFPPPGKQLNPWEMTENQNIVINSAKSVGCQIVNIHANDLIHASEEHKEYLVLGMIWQVVKLQLLSQISIMEHPELFRLLQEGESLQDFMKQAPEDILLRWINHHLKADGCDRQVANFSELKDGEVYLRVLHRLDPTTCSLEALSNPDPVARAVAVIENAKAMDLAPFIQPADITSGNRRLNLAFVAQLFNTKHGLDATKDEMQKIEEAFEAAGVSEEPEEDAREERVFRMWMNSLNLGGGETQIRRLFNDLNDGLNLLDAIEKVVPSTIDEKKVNKDRQKLNRFKKLENCNYAVELGKTLGFSLPGLGGIDIANGNPKLVLGFVWQLMRLQMLRMLQTVGGGHVPKDADILQWANTAVAESGKASRITSFKDPSLSTGEFLLDLLAAVEPRAINATLVTPGDTPEGKQSNAKYVISVARKIGALVFLTWEDIVDVKPKMIMTLVASIEQKAKERAAKKASGA